MSLALFLAALFWLAHLFRIFCRLVQFSEIRRFFISQLEIADSEMQNLSWAQVSNNSVILLWILWEKSLLNISRQF